jgi:hypothetical protein
MIKRAYSTQMTFDISDSEKDHAEKALIYFNYVIKLLKKASDHLNIMKTPFKDNANTTPESIVAARAALRRFRDQSVDNFNEFKVSAFKCVNIMQIFLSDTQAVKVIKSFITSIDELEKKFNEFVRLFNDLDNNEFPTKAVSLIESVQKQCDELEEIIEDRIKNHIQKNILAKNWVNSVSDDLQVQLEKKTPLVVDLFNKRQEQLNNELKQQM